MTLNGYIYLLLLIENIGYWKIATSKLCITDFLFAW